MPINETVLLTGATGLVGGQLLSRLLCRGVDVAVLVRRSRTASAEQRVEQALVAFEKSSLLPRPRVIVADLAASGIGVCAEDRAWLAERPLRVLHCAGSIRFKEDAVTREPFTSNVGGTQNLLAFVQGLDTRAFHFVSTAYVQNGYKGVCREERVPSPALATNDYERSKILAEQAVLEREGIGPVTIHRPSIVVGDSQTYATSTYHGFYAPLQVAMQFAAKHGFDEQAGKLFREQLGLAKTDVKNLVPVDWVAESIVRTLVSDACGTAVNTRASADILHWTNPNAVPCEDIQLAISDVVQSRSRPPGNKRVDEVARPSPTEFRSLLSIYEAYFRCDPVFDCSRSKARCPGLPCPRVDRDLLFELASSAVNTNFGWPQPRACPVPHQKIVRTLREIPWGAKADCRGVRDVITLNLLGPGAPEKLVFGETNSRWRRLGGAVPSLALEVRCTTRMEVLANCINGTTDVVDSMAQGLWMAESTDQEKANENIKNWMSDVQSISRQS